MKEGPALNKSYQFALRTVCLCRRLRDPAIRSVVDQFLSAGTGIGSNIEEATAAESRRDFPHKMKIALKEARESHYWLRLFRDSAIGPPQEVTALLALADELKRMLTSITKTTGESLS